MAAGGRPGGPGRGRPRSPLCWKAIELFPLEPLGPATEGGGRITAPAQERGAQEQKGEASDVHGPAGPNGLTVSIQVRSGPFRSSNAPASRQTGSISDSGGRTTTTTARMADCRLQTAECRPQNRRTVGHRTTGPQGHRTTGPQDRRLQCKPQPGCRRADCIRKRGEGAAEGSRSAWRTQHTPGECLSNGRATSCSQSVSVGGGSVLQSVASQCCHSNAQPCRPTPLEDLR